MGGLVTKWTPTKCGPNIAPRRRTLSHSGLLTKCGREFFAPCGGLCHAADSNQMWSIMFVVERIIHHSQSGANKTSIP